MKPLTIEEIKNLEVGDWVWVTNIHNEYGRYERIKAGNDKILSMVSDGTVRWEHYSNYGTEWIAYKNKEQAECDNSYDLLKVKYEIVLKEYAKLKRKATKYNFMTKTIDKEITKQAEQKLKELRGEYGKG